MKFLLSRSLLLLAIFALAFSCEKETIIDQQEAVTVGQVEQFLGMEINEIADFPDYYKLSDEEINQVIEYVDAQFDAAESGEIEMRTNFLNYRLFTLAVLRAGLINEFVNDQVTVFAPNNDAFAAIGIADSRALLQVAPSDLVDILSYHIVPSGRLFSTDLESVFYPTLAGPAVKVDVSGGGVTVNNVDVVEADIFFAFFFNGVAHGIDQVLTAPKETIVDIAIDFSNGNPAEFTQLVAAVVRADLAGTLSGPGPFTVFAPTDAAFNELFDALDTDVNSIDIDVLTDVLLYHVVPARVFSTDLENGPVNTLNGTVTIDLDELEIIDTTNEPAGLIPSLLDVQGSNGVIHVIDKVLIPEL
jgi:transforming growth factor-beta-induced protein